MNVKSKSWEERRRSTAGQILVIAVLGMVAMLGGVALVLEGGNMYAQQRATQAGADAAAEAGATTIAQSLALDGTGKTDADVLNAVTQTATANGIDHFTAYYTDIYGKPLDSSGLVVSDPTLAAKVGGGVLPPVAQGVHLDGDHTFPAYFGQAIGFNQFTAGAKATAVTGRLTGGVFMPVVFPINVVDCNQNGSLGSGEDQWKLSQPGDPPVGQEYIVPLCKTGAGNFMILDLNPSMSCEEEIQNPPAVQWDLPTWVDSDNGNDCAKKIAENMPAWYHKVVTIPICDASPDSPCNQQNTGSNAQYWIVKVTAFYVDYMSYTNNKNNSLCQSHDGLVTIAGNGSDSCIAGWFVRYITVGPVGPGPVGNSDAIGVQLIQ